MERTLVLFFTMVVGSALSQTPRVVLEPDIEFKTKVLQIVFPKTGLERSAVEVAVILHFKPSSQPEEEILLGVTSNGAARVEYRVAAVVSQRIFQTLGGRPRVQPEEAVKRFGVRTTTMDVSGSVARGWLSNFWAAMAASSLEQQKKVLSREVQMDGTLYSCDYREEGRHTSMSVSGTELGQEVRVDDFALVIWMDSVRRAVLAGRLGQK